MKVSSNILLYFMFKYFFAYLGIGSSMSVYQSWRSDNSLLVPVLIFILNLSLHLLLSPRVFSVTIGREGIERRDKMIEWKDVISINRLQFLFIVRLRNDKWFCFPVDYLPGTNFAGVTDSTMYQYVIKKKKELGI